MRLYTVNKLKIGVAAEPPEELIKNSEYKSCDILLFGYGLFGETFISAESELLPVKKMAEISREFNGVLIAPGPTDVYGLKYKSAFVFRNGSLIDIADRVKNNGGDEYENSYRLMVYRINGVRCGIVLDSDTLYLHTFEKFLSVTDVLLYAGQLIDGVEQALDAAGKPYVAVLPNQTLVKRGVPKRQTKHK